ncbi:MAG: AI-2E family transporter [Verrucomicrobiota bacterium]
MSEPLKQRGFYPLILFAAGLYVVIANFSKLSPILLAIILIVLISLAINPLIAKLRGLFGGRTLTTGILVLLFFVIAALTGWAFYNPIQRSATKFVQRLPQYWERIQRPLLKMEQKAVISEQKLKKEVTTEVAKETGQVMPNEPPPEPVIPDSERKPASAGMVHSGLGALFGGITGSFKGLAANAASMVLVIVTVFFGVVFTLLKPRPMFRMLFGLIPEQKHPRAEVIVARIAEFIPRWALATLLGMTIIGFMIFFAMWPLFGFQDALVLGVIALVFEAVPYIGPLLSAVPALLLAAGEGGFKPLWVLIAYVCVQALENNLIMPVVVGGQLRLHPVAVIFSMLLCVTIFGVLGVLIALPMLAILIIFYEEVYRPRFLPHVSESDLEKIAETMLKKNRLPSAARKPAPRGSESKPPK